MNSTVQQLLDAFAALPEEHKHQVANEICAAQYKTLMKKAYDRIQELMEEAHRDAEIMIEAMRSKAANEIQSDMNRLKNEIKVAQDAAIQGVFEAIRDQLGKKFRGAG